MSRSELENQIISVEASAGTGKTFNLSRKFIQFLFAHGVGEKEFPFSEILAITFTKKAALEMKSRIIEFLKMIALGDYRSSSEKEALLSALGPSSDSAARKAGAAMDHLIRHYDDLRVQTIDSFVNSVLTSCALRLGYSSNMDTCDDHREYLEYSLDTFLRAAGKDKKTKAVSEEFLRNYIFVEGKEGWLMKKGLLSVLGWLMSLKNVHGTSVVKRGKGPAEIISRKKAVVKLIRELNEKLPEGTHGTFVKQIASVARAHEDTFSLDGLSKYFAKDEFPGTKKCDPSGEVLKLWDRIRKGLRSLAETEAYARFDCYAEFFQRIDVLFDEVSRSEDVIFLFELNRRLMRLFSEGISVDELYYRMSARFRYFLIDEFQDTNLVQWRNFEPLVREALSVGGALYYVGDKKQAIYRFRGGEPRLFDAVREELQPYPAKRDVLDVNYRSQREIVSFNNTVFSQENLLKFLKENFLKDQAEDGICLASGAFKEVCGVFEGAAQKNARNDRDGFVRIEALEGASKEEREDQARARVIPLVKELMKRFRPGDIAILTRTNHEAGTVTEWLLTEGVQCQSDRTLNIRENPVVKDIISFLRFLDSPIDNIAFAAFILGDVFVAASGISRNELREFIFRAHLSSGGKRVANLYTLFREKYPDVWAGLAKEFFKKAGTIPVYEFITGIINKLKVLESFPGDQAYVMRLLEFCRKYEADYPSLTLFLEFFDRAREEEFFVYVKDADSVRVMTVHQAKGLEFGAVIIPFLKMDVKLGESGQEDGEVRTSRPCIVEHDDKGVSLVYYNKDHGRHSPELASLYGEHYKRAIVDELDIIYVSLTRAKDELYIFCPRKANKGANPVLGLFPSVPAEYGSISGLSRSDADEAERKEIPVTGQADWFSIIGEEFVTADEIKNRKNILRGDVFHYIFSCVGHAGISDMDGILESALSAAGARYPMISDLSPYIVTVRSILSDPSFGRFFRPEKAEIYREKEVIDREGRTKRLDRLIVSPDEVLILDYKMYPEKEHDGPYKEQVREYVKIMGEIYPGRKCRGFLLYVNDRRAEEVL